MRRLTIGLLLAIAPLAALAFEVNGVALGGSEDDVKKAFPSAHCKPLEWKSEAADRRCDDAKIAVGGVGAKVTFYLRRDAIQGFDLRFEVADRERVAAFFKSRWGAPRAEATDTISRGDQPERKVYKVRWEQGRDTAILSARLESKRGSLAASRGDFANEIYRVR